MPIIPSPQTDAGDYTNVPYEASAINAADNAQAHAAQALLLFNQIKQRISTGTPGAHSLSDKCVRAALKASRSATEAWIAAADAMTYDVDSPDQQESAREAAIQALNDADDAAANANRALDLMTGF